MTKDIKTISNWGRYAYVLLTQITANPEYLLLWIIGTSLAIGYFETTNLWAWGAIGVFNLLLGLLGVASVVRVVDRAVQSLDIGFHRTGFGHPDWIVSGARPFSQETFKIKAAGFSAEDFERFLPHISSRHCRPVHSIRKVSAAVPVIEICTRRTEIPNSLNFSTLDVASLRPGCFFVGHTGVRLIEKHLSDLPHLLVAGQTGSGKTTFIQQMLATILTRTPFAHAVLTDMKGGIDFPAFEGVPNLEMVTNDSGVQKALDGIQKLYELRKAYLVRKKAKNWYQLSTTELAAEETLKGSPIGPVVVVFDELAELARIMRQNGNHRDFQDQLASFSTLYRFAAIHLVFGAQRPDKDVIDTKGKDVFPARMCFSVPSVAASTVVLGDMSAATLGAHPGRAVFRLEDKFVVQAPFITDAHLGGILTRLKERLARSQYRRKIIAPDPSVGNSSGKAALQ